MLRARFDEPWGQRNQRRPLDVSGRTRIGIRKEWRIRHSFQDVSGDGDFCRLLEDVQGMGVRVSVVSTTKTSPPMVADSLRRMADVFIEMEELRDDIAKSARQNSSAIT